MDLLKVAGSQSVSGDYLHELHNRIFKFAFSKAVAGYMKKEVLQFTVNQFREVSGIEKDEITVIVEDAYEQGLKTRE